MSALVFYSKRLSPSQPRSCWSNSWDAHGPSSNISRDICLISSFTEPPVLNSTGLSIAGHFFLLCPLNLSDDRTLLFSKMTLSDAFGIINLSLGPIHPLK